MIDNPENGHKPEIRDTEADPARDVHTATTVAEPDAQISKPGEMRSEQPSASTPKMSSQTVTPFSSELSKFRQSFEEIQAEFIGEPRAAVEKAEKLIDGLMNALHVQLQRVHSNVVSETDTEQLRVAMLSYRELFDSLGGHRAA